MRSSQRFLAIAALGVMLATENSSHKKRNFGGSVTEPIQKIPTPRKGCKQYNFNQWGIFRTGTMNPGPVVFICFASNDKNAIRKFKNWEANEKNKVS